jgi:hypothetical protein
MPNITLNVDAHVLSTVRKHAVERKSSVNRLVREYLTNLAAQTDRAAGARGKLRELSERSEFKLGRKKWDRADLHER